MVVPILNGQCLGKWVFLEQEDERACPSCVPPRLQWGEGRIEARKGLSTSDEFCRETQWGPLAASGVQPAGSRCGRRDGREAASTTALQQAMATYARRGKQSSGPRSRSTKALSTVELQRLAAGQRKVDLNMSAGAILEERHRRHARINAEQIRNGMAHTELSVRARMYVAWSILEDQVRLFRAPEAMEEAEVGVVDTEVLDEDAADEDSGEEGGTVASAEASQTMDTNVSEEEATAVVRVTEGEEVVTGRGYGAVQCLAARAERNSWTLRYTLPLLPKGNFGVGNPFLASEQVYLQCLHV